MDRESNSAIDPHASRIRPAYLSLKDLAVRWSCSRTTAQRIAHRAGLTRFLLGEGRNGMVRFALDEVESYENERAMRA